MSLRRASRLRGFTLLEVLVAVAILGLGLTVILSSQTGLFTSASRGEHLTAASNLVRCKMGEIELMLEQKGFSLTDENDEGPCCDDESEGYNCSWKIERVELPPMPDASLDASGSPSAAPSGSAAPGFNINGALNAQNGLGAVPGPGALPGPAGLGALSATGGPLTALANISATQGASLGDKPTPAGVMQQLGSVGASGMEGLVMGFVYPSLKPMLEASIRRITVKVTWREGERPKELEVTQFLTRPQEGQLGTADMLGLPQLNDALSGALGGTAAPAVPGVTPAAAARGK